MLTLFKTQQYDSYDNKRTVHIYRVNLDLRVQLLTTPLLVNLDVDGIHTEKPVEVDMLRLTESPQATHSLRLASIVDFLGGSQERGKEDGVVSGRQIGAASTFVHDVQQKNAFR